MSEKIKCPRCGIMCKRHSRRKRRVLDVDGYIEYYAEVYVCPLHKYFTADNDTATKGSRYSKSLVALGKEFLTEYTIEETIKKLKEICGVRIPYTTLSEWRRR